MGAPQRACHTVECPLPGGAVPRLWMPGYRASSSVGICGRGSDLATTSPWGGLDAAGVPDLRTQLGPCWLCVPILSRARTSRAFLVCRKCEIVSVGQATQRGAASPHSGGYTDPRGQHQARAPPCPLPHSLPRAAPTSFLNRPSVQTPSAPSVSTFTPPARLNIPACAQAWLPLLPLLGRQMPPGGLQPSTWHLLCLPTCGRLLLPSSGFCLPSAPDCELPGGQGPCWPVLTGTGRAQGTVAESPEERTCPTGQLSCYSQFDLVILSRSDR